MFSSLAILVDKANFCLAHSAIPGSLADPPVKTTPPGNFLTLLILCNYQGEVQMARKAQGLPPKG